LLRQSANGKRKRCGWESLAAIDALNLERLISGKDTEGHRVQITESEAKELSTFVKQKVDRETIMHYCRDERKEGMLYDLGRGLYWIQRKNIARVCNLLQLPLPNDIGGRVRLVNLVTHVDECFTFSSVLGRSNSVLKLFNETGNMSESKFISSDAFNISNVENGFCFYNKSKNALTICRASGGNVIVPRHQHAPVCVGDILVFTWSSQPLQHVCIRIEDLGTDEVTKEPTDDVVTETL